MMILLFSFFFASAFHFEAMKGEKHLKAVEKKEKRHETKDSNNSDNNSVILENVIVDKSNN